MGADAGGGVPLRLWVVSGSLLASAQKPSAGKELSERLGVSRPKSKSKSKSKSRPGASHWASASRPGEVQSGGGGQHCGGVVVVVVVQPAAGSGSADGELLARRAAS